MANISAELSQTERDSLRVMIPVSHMARRDNLVTQVRGAPHSEHSWGPARTKGCCNRPPQASLEPGCIGAASVPPVPPPLQRTLPRPPQFFERYYGKPAYLNDRFWTAEHMKTEEYAKTLASTHVT